MKTLTIIRETGKSLPIPTAIEWSPTFGKPPKKKHTQTEGDENNGATMSQSSTSVTESMDRLIDFYCFYFSPF